MIENSKFCVIGVGGAGCRIISHLVREPGVEYLKLIAIDTDRNGLAECGLDEEHTILAGEKWRNGRGTGGRVIDGQSAFSPERRRIEEMIKGSQMLIICGGLGGGTASGGIPIVLSCASNMQIPAVTVLSQPFAVEGLQRQRISEQAMNNEIIRIADAAILIPNDLLFAGLDPATPLAEAFQLADREMARSVLALSTILCAGNLLNADFSDFSALLRRKKSHCALGIGVIDTANEGSFTAEKAFEKLLESPLLGGASTLCDADAVIFTLTGGPELSLSDARSVFAISTSHIGKKTSVLVGAAVDEKWRGKFQYTALAVNYEKEALPAGSQGTERKKSKRQSRLELSDGDMIQQTLPLSENEFSRGIMEKTTPVRWNGEELDIPTFLRKNQVIDTGKDQLS
ncbi:MAG: hypothetical protein IJC21_06550 [Lentisphaeria bacterium]|nr:hypothetical protein [Lentisphaeria bacterium]